jgi:single-strand DNA-binding protein
MINLAILLGHLGQDAILQYNNEGTARLAFSVAAGKRDFTTWHNIVAFGKLAELRKNLQKGDLVYVEGEHRSTTYKDKDGISRQRDQVVAKDIKLIRAKNPKTREESDDYSF